MTGLENLNHIRIALNTLVGIAALGFLLKVWQLIKEGKF
ncbi:hypothetical protein LCGC14_2000010 [marine sediment metagenome]|uniref:Uncharacterized protein n=1 Tax=marine sediment metagenome TaxID=412755 RepID=A0A0F9I0L0_9ZZZZ